MFEDRDLRTTQQSETDDRGAAADDIPADGVHSCRQDPPGGDKVDLGRTCGMDSVPASRPAPPPHPRAATPTEMRTDLAQLESAFPAFSFAICTGWRGPRFEAWRVAPQGGLYAIITDDAGELWRELPA